VSEGLITLRYLFVKGYNYNASLCGSYVWIVSQLSVIRVTPTVPLHVGTQRLHSMATARSVKQNKTPPSSGQKSTDVAGLKTAIFPVA
jgi:hypothetical protein